MNFNDITYVRPDVDEFETVANGLLDRLQNATTFVDASDALHDYVDARRPVTTMLEIAGIRHTIDTTDEFYAAENDFVDEASPRFEALDNRLYGLLLDSTFVDEFTAELGETFMSKIALARKVFAPGIADDLAAENKIVTAYNKLTGGAQIEFRGSTYTLSGLGVFAEDPDRATRKEALEASWGYFAEHADEFDKLFDDLVAVRTTMARKLGYQNFVQMGYDRLRRAGYTPADVKRFREGVVEHVVPRAVAVFEAQRERLGLDELTYYDVPFTFPSGTPKPQGEEAWMRDRAQTMYDELAPETSELFTKLNSEGFMDLTQKKGKQPGGYCTIIERVGMPFIFSNFNGTSHDAEVLTHEFGHALAFYSSRDLFMAERMFPGYEAAEVHSMSMEYLTYPWMESFFGPDAIKQHYAHQAGNITFIPYGACIDAFQEWVYENPEATPSQRKAQWRELEGVYTPWVNYADNEFLESGGRWQRQAHLFHQAFYYIDYCLAQLSAMQVFLRSQEDPEATWAGYMAMCKVGGTVDFVEMLHIGGLRSPFDPLVVGETLDGIEADMASIDPEALR